MDTTNPYPLIKAVRERLSDRAAWTQNMYARDRNGKPVGSSSPQATRWCVRGALYRESTAPERVLEFTAANTLLANVARELFGTSGLTYVNDHLGYDAVIKMLDTALFECRAE